MNKLLSAAIVCVTLALSGCVTPGVDRPPIEVWPEMDRQYKWKPQEKVAMFGDHRASRLAVPGTVARGDLREDIGIFEGQKDGIYIGRNPVPMTEVMLRRGQQRFDIYCAPCHGRTGLGNGIVPKRALGWIPQNLQDDRIIQMPDGEIFDVITHGRRSMPPYHTQTDVPDRWAIVGYVRVLQRAYHSSLEDVPADLRAEVK